MQKVVVVVNWSHMSFFIAAKVSVPIDLVSEVSSFHINLGYLLLPFSVNYVRNTIEKIHVLLSI